MNAMNIRSVMKRRGIQTIVICDMLVGNFQYDETNLDFDDLYDNMRLNRVNYRN